MGKFIDLTNKTFGRLTVIKRVENDKRSNIQWLCECNCENKNKIVVRGYSLKSGDTKSCGCLMREKIIEINKSRRKYNTYDLTGEYGIGYTSNTNEEFYFDLEDYDKIKNYCWYIDKDGYIKTVSDNKYNILIHRIITNCPNGMEVDHIFHNKFDNRKEFLRIVTSSQNGMNSGIQSNNTSGITGVNWHSRDEEWIARIYVNGKQIYLGGYDNFEDAVDARKEAEEKYFGEYRYKKLVIKD